MALKKCKDCGHEVSKKASSCPNCGSLLKKPKRKTSTFIWLFLILIVLAVWVQSKKDSTTTTSTTNKQSSVHSQKSVPKKPRVSQEAQEKFKTWALQNTAVTYVEYPEKSDWQIWVKLKPEKYTPKENVENIALSIARAYKLQTGFKELVIVTVWHPQKSEIVAKGRL